MVTIRLARGGAKKRPFYHLVAADSRSPRDGRYIERIGYFNPIARGQELRFKFDSERLEHWISNGAQTTSRVASLLKECKKSGENNEMAARPVKVIEPKAAIPAPAADADASQEEADTTEE